MDLGIKGRQAVLCGSSKGLGFACAQALVNEGVHVVLNGRDANRLQEAVKKLSKCNDVKVTGVVGDVTTSEGREALLEVCPDPDILLNNSGGPSPLQFLDVMPDDWTKVLEGNMKSPLLLIRAVLPKMMERRFGRIINITSAMVTTPRPHHVLSAGARAGLTASLKGLSFEVAPYNITINNLLPERFDTDRQEQMAKAAMKRENITFEEARKKQIESIAAKRLGDPREFGAFFAFLCSNFAGYMSGQNFHLDGGSYPALI